MFKKLKDLMVVLMPLPAGHKIAALHAFNKVEQSATTLALEHDSFSVEYALLIVKNLHLRKSIKRSPGSALRKPEEAFYRRARRVRPILASCRNYDP